MLDYQELLEKEHTLVTSSVVYAPPSRPSSSSAVASATTRAASAYTSRKHKQQVLAMGRTAANNNSNNNAVRSQTSLSSAARASPPARTSDSIGEPRDSSNNGNQTQTKTSSSIRAQTAGATPKKSARASSVAYTTSNNTSNLPGIDVTESSSRRRSLFTSLNSDRDEDSQANAEPLFHFPTSAAAASSPFSGMASTRFADTASPETPADYGS